ncbi:MAG TPA: type II secretion system F family protein [Nitrososphaerales archaeon]|nr:type II secretion system F family protein [Nitrososphaerales archaeon]
MSFRIRLTKGADKQKTNLTLSDSLTRLSFRIFSRPATYISRSIPLLRDAILKSNLRITPEGLVSLALFFTTISGGLAAVGIYIGFGVFHVPYFLSLLAVVPLVFVIVINLPKVSASSRASAINIELPFVVGYISVLAGGGVSPLATLRRIASMKLFPASAREARRVLVEVDVFGQDPISAIESIARWNPSRPFSEFLFGYTAILKSGGNFMAYVQSKLRDIMQSKAAAVKRSADTTGTMAEAYLTVTVILGMVLYTLYMVQTLISHDLSGLTNLYFFAFIIVPLISAAFIWLIDAVQPKWPYVDYRPYRYFMFTIPAAAIFFFLPLGLHLYLKTSITLIMAMSLPAIQTSRYSRERSSLEKELPEFIRDVAEGRKTGLSPEVAIERLGGRHYGILSPHVKKMGAQLSWGVSLSTVVSTFTAAVGSWITKAIGVLLIEVVDVGGGTIRSFSDMAEFTRDINEMEGERRAALRPFVYITYVAGVMVIITTFILVYLLNAPAISGIGASSVPQVDPNTIDLLLTTAVFDSFIIGIVAGKMGESGVSDGFKHSIFLVIASLIAIAVARQFINIPI